MFQIKFQKSLKKAKDIIDAQFAEFSMRGYKIERTGDKSLVDYGFYFKLNKDDLLFVSVWANYFQQTKPVKIALCSNSDNVKPVFHKVPGVEKLGAVKKMEDNWTVFGFYDKILTDKNCHHKIFLAIEEVLAALELSPKNGKAKGYA